jgi:hypothetical protein
MTVSIEDQIKCVRREIGMRERVYARRVADKAMTQAQADKEIGAMKAVLASLVAIDHTATQGSLDEMALRKAVSFELAELVIGARPAQGAML